jgi:hypothetical protein
LEEGDEVVLYPAPCRSYSSGGTRQYAPSQRVLLTFHPSTAYYCILTKTFRNQGAACLSFQGFPHILATAGCVPRLPTVGPKKSGLLTTANRKNGFLKAVTPGPEMEKGPGGLNTLQPYVIKKAFKCYTFMYNY